MMQLSEIGGHLTARTGIDDLMEDLFKASIRETPACAS